MSNKLAKLPPPGQSILPVRYPYPTQSGPPQTFTILSMHQGARFAHMAHGGLYNPLIGWGLMAAHGDLLANETIDLVKHWLSQESRIITLDGQPREQMLTQQAEETPLMQQVRAFQMVVLQHVDGIQQTLKAEAERIAAKANAEEAPKNGHDASAEIHPN